MSTIQEDKIKELEMTVEYLKTCITRLEKRLNKHIDMSIRNTQELNDKLDKTYSIACEAYEDAGEAHSKFETYNFKRNDH